MKIKPIITDHIKTKHTSFEVDLRLEYNVTFISGDSGTGKSAVYSFLQEYAAENKNVRCFNYLDQKKAYKNSIKQSKGKLFVIDNADILLDDDMRRYIAFDDKNQYIIIGRNPTGLQLTVDEIFELQDTNVDGITLFRIKKSF
jgi:ABC-type lipoprotein export system ATPase subunit